MQRLVDAFSPDGAPVVVRSFACNYRALKEGVYAKVDFEVLRSESGAGVEAVEFTFVLIDIFDSFLTSIQGIAGPGKYSAGPKKHKARWVLAMDGAFSQYHALCFPSQARLIDGAVWRCNRDACIAWLNGELEEAGVVLTEEDVFPQEAAREGTSE